MTTALKKKSTFNKKTMVLLLSSLLLIPSYSTEIIINDESTALDDLLAATPGPGDSITIDGIEIDGDNNVLQDKGTISITNGGVIENFEIKSNTVVKVGRDSQAINSVFTNGSQQIVFDGGTIEDTTIDNSSSTLKPDSYSIGFLSIKNNGVLNIELNGEDPTSIDNFSLDEDSVANIWNIAGEDVTLTLNNEIKNEGKIKIINSVLGAYTTIEVEDFSGTGGVIVMNTDIVNGKGDMLLINNELADDVTQKISIQNNGSANATKDDTLTVIMTAGSKAGQFTLDAYNNVVELGGYEFVLKQADNGNDWELAYLAINSGPGGTGTGGTGTGGVGIGLTSTADAAANSIVSTYLANFVENQSLLHRMGDLKNGNDYGVWARMYAGKLKSRVNDLLSGFNMKYYTIQLGIDFKQSLNQASLYLGGAVSYMDADQDFDKRSYGLNPIYGNRSGSGTLKGYGLALYATYIHDDGLYVDALFRYSYMKNKFNVLDTAGALINGKYSTNVFSTSVEVGKQYYFTPEKQGLYATPQVQLTYSSFDQDTVKASNGLRVNIGSRDSIIGRLGSELGYTLNDADPKNIFFKISYLKEFSNDGRFVLNTSPENYSMKSSWWQYEIGANTQINKDHNLYMNLNYNRGKHFNQRQINIGYRYTF